MARTNHALGWLGALALGTLIGSACGERDSSLERSIDLMDAPIALRGELVFIDKNDRAFLLDVSGSELSPEAQVIALPHDPKLAVRRSGKDKDGEVLVLTGGRRASDSERAEPATLTAIEHDGHIRKYTLGNPFDRMQQSEDGRYVFMFKSGSSERLLDNPNEIAIVDLNKQPKDKDAINLRTLRSFEDAPLSVVYSPPMALLGETRRLAIVLSHSNVTLIDLDHISRRETTVQLSGLNDAKVEPAQVAFDPMLPKLYVRGSASNDVFVFSLSARPGGTMGDDGDKQEHNDFRPSIDQLGVGALPSDMSLYDSPSGSRLLVLSASSMQASVVSATAVTDVPLEAGASKLMVFNAPSPRDHNSAPRALLYDDGGSTLQFLDLSDIEERGKRNLEVVDLPSPIAKLVPMPGEPGRPHGLAAQLRSRARRCRVRRGAPPAVGRAERPVIRRLARPDQRRHARALARREHRRADADVRVEPRGDRALEQRRLRDADRRHQSEARERALGARIPDRRPARSR
jgi:hypothetical protein